jgi:transcription antitermination factor NusG
MRDRQSDAQIPGPERMSGTVLPWYAIRVQARFEKVASAVLGEKGFDAFLPLYRAKHQWSDRVKQVELPLFPGYLFCRIDIGDRLVPVVTTPGVLGIVSAGRCPVPIADSEVEAVQSVVRSGLPAFPWPTLISGTPVLIERGPLAGVEGVVTEVERKHRLIVSLPLLQRSVAVEIERDWVRPLSAGNLGRNVPDGFNCRIRGKCLEPRVSAGIA